MFEVSILFPNIFPCPIHIGANPLFEYHLQILSIESVTQALQSESDGYKSRSLTYFLRLYLLICKMDIAYLLHRFTVATNQKTTEQNLSTQSVVGIFMNFYCFDHTVQLRNEHK